MNRDKLPEGICPVCGKPTVFVSRWGKPRVWEHAYLRDTPVPWHDPSPATQERKSGILR